MFRAGWAEQEAKGGLIRRKSESRDNPESHLSTPSGRLPDLELRGVAGGGEERASSSVKDSSSRLDASSSLTSEPHLALYLRTAKAMSLDG